jgi:hypothetical protein
MSRRNRMVLTAIGLVATLSLTAPAPSHAMGLWESGIPMADTLAKAWSWLASHLPGSTPRQRTAPRVKEGGMINPNGGGSLITDPILPVDNADEGGMINPNGDH